MEVLLPICCRPSPSKPPLPPLFRVDGVAPDWVTAIGAWGDVFGACGNIVAMLEASGSKQAGVLYYGFDPSIARFLEAQTWVREVLHVSPGDREEYQRVVSRACSSRETVEAWAAPLLQGTGVSPARLRAAHIDFHLQTAPVVYRWSGAALPRGEAAWAAKRVPKGADCYLLNPISTQSSSLESHWPYWDDAIRWLLSETEHTYLLVGQGWDPGRFGEHPRLVNLVGQTPSMLHVLALSRRCRGMITTSNSLSMWSVIQGIPAVICCNGVMNHQRNYFRMWIEAEPNRLVFQGEPLARFQAAARGFLY